MQTERAGLAGNDRFGAFATDRWSPKIAPCPLFPESDAKSEPWHRSRGDTGVVAVSPECPVMTVARFYRAYVGARPSGDSLDVHLQDRGVVHEPVDGCQYVRTFFDSIGQTLPI